MRHLIVIGGGCYGRLHATRLLAAKDRGLIAFERLLVVDREARHLAYEAVGDRADVDYVTADWGAFLKAYMAASAVADDHVVPAPLAPHLLADWLEAALREDLPGRTVASERVSHTFDQPYARHGADGCFYFSFADWTCPVSCTEPATCPAIRAPRTWEQARFLRELVQGNAAIAGLATFECRQLTSAIGTVAVGELLAARERLRAAAEARPAEPLTFLVATVSACHGAIGQLGVR